MYGLMDVKKVKSACAGLRVNQREEPSCIVVCMNDFFCSTQLNSGGVCMFPGVCPVFYGGDGGIVHNPVEFSLDSVYSHHIIACVWEPRRRRKGQEPH